MGYTGRLSGLLVAPNSGNYTFRVCSNDAAELYLSTDSSPDNKEKIVEQDGPCPSSAKSVQKTLVQGELYYIEAIQRHDTATGNITNNLQIFLFMHNTELTTIDLKAASVENQGINIKDNNRVLEQQQITIEGDPG